MDLAEIRKLVRLMLRAELSELEIDDSNRGFRLMLKRSAAGEGTPSQLPPVVQVIPTPGATPGGVAPLQSTSSAPSLGEDDELPPGVEAVKSPLVGTFYRAPSPEAEDFVEVGSPVGVDTVLCIVEAMKVMNEIKAELKGEVIEILVENGEPVEFGQPILLIKRG